MRKIVNAKERNLKVVSGKVSGGVNKSGSKKSSPRLSELELRTAEESGMSPEEYAKWKPKR
jgi:hypothetical protein